MNGFWDTLLIAIGLIGSGWIMNDLHNFIKNERR